MDFRFELIVVIDTSALIAILLKEPEALAFARFIESSEHSCISAVSYFEAAIVVDRRGNEVSRAMLDSFLVAFSIRVEPVTFEHAKMARQTYELFGKGRHPAGLNFADCFSYALAKSLLEPLLFKGNDFSKTDLTSAAS